MAKHVIGDPKALAFIVDWIDEGRLRTAAERTRGRLQLILADLPIWSNDGLGIEWTWIELLEHLASIWHFLAYQEDLSLGRSGSTDPQSDYGAFRSVHDLAEGLQGIWLPSLLIVRSGKAARVRSGQFEVLAPWTAISTALVEFGNAIVLRLNGFGELDPRATTAISEWESRDEITHDDAIRMYLGTAQKQLQAYSPQYLPQPGSQFAPTHVLAAARFAYGRVNGNDWPLLLDAVSDASKTTISLDSKVAQLSAAAHAALSNCKAGSKPFVQGQVVAGAVREALGIAATALDVATLLAQMSVQFREIELASSALDAIAVWPAMDAAVIIINVNGAHSQGFRGRNATIAHELCHLLLDRDSALPLVDVNGGRVPLTIERRARAFAAELLAPRLALLPYIDQLRSQPTPVVVEAISKSLLVSNEIVAWQLLNRIEGDLPVEIRANLAELVGVPAA